MKFVLLAILLFPLSTRASCELSTSLTPTIDFAKMWVVFVQEVTFHKAREFLDQHGNNTDFKVKEAAALIDELKKIGDDVKSPGNVRSMAYLYIGGIHGRISDKLRSNGGTEHGRKALKALKLAIHFDGNNKNAGKAYATTIHRMIEKNAATRFFIQKGMNIDLDDEAAEAAEVLEKMGLTGDPAYKDLKDF